MKLNSITITAEASKAYQKFGVSFTAEEVEKEDIQLLKNWAIKEAKDGIEKLCPTPEDAKVETKVIQPYRKSEPESVGDALTKHFEPETKIFQVDGGFCVEYKKCYNKAKGEFFYAKVDETQPGPKYQKWED